MQEENHPFFTGEPFGGPKGMLFLGSAATPATIDIAVPAGTPIFCPVVCVECSNIEPPPYHGDNEAELRACARAIVDETIDLIAEIDGVAVKNLAALRAQSSMFEFGPLPEGNLFDYAYGDVPAGTTGFSVAAGVYLLLPPFSVGTHFIRVSASYPSWAGGLLVETTYNITVVP